MSRDYSKATVLFCAFLTLSVSAAAQFETRATSPVTTSPFNVAVGDFNHDGKLDLAVAGNELQVLLGNGDGTFQPPVTVAPGLVPNWVATADFNHDGNLDLAVADFSDFFSGVSILLGNGDGTFQAPVNYSTPNAAPFIAVGDFNGDHNLDVVVLDDLEVSVLLGNGDGTFQEPAINTTPSYAPSVLAIGDFNRDGKLDVVVAEQFGGLSQVQILLGNGDGTFALGDSYAVGAEPTGIAVADFNGDGKLDLAVSCLLGLGVEVLLGNGDGTFQPAVTYPVQGSTWVVAADFNGDGKLDLAVGMSVVVSGGVTVFPGKGDGTFGPGTYYADGRWNWSLAVGDFNGDRRTDLSVVDYFHLSHSVITMLNTGVVSFSPNTPLSFPTQLVGTTSAAQNVKLTNTGTTALSIASKRVSSPFQLASGTTCGSSVAPGANCALSVTFTPTVIGLKSGLLSISDSASTKPQVIELSGTGTVISLSPTQLNFGSQKVGTKSAPQNVTVTNTGSTTVNVASVKIAGNDSKDYSETNTCDSQIAPGASCTISVTFAPIRTGTRNADAQISDSGGRSPQQVPLTGTGT
jgi:hypothetical protein